MAEKILGLIFRKIPLIVILTGIMISVLLLSSQVFSHTIISGSVLVRNSKQSEKMVDIRLNGATEYELVDVFGKVLNLSPGVLDARRHGSRIIPDNAKACFAKWRVRVDGNEASRLQANIMKTIRDIRSTGGQIAVSGSVYRFTALEVDVLKKIQQGSIVGSEIQFMAY